MRSFPGQDVLVVIPCYNEAETIAETIREVQEYLPKSEIVVIDNNSSDETYKIALSMGVRVINEPRRGKGFALTRGFSELSPHHKVVFMLDGDGTYEVSPIIDAYYLIVNKNYEMVVGKREPLPDTKNAYRRGHVLGNRLFQILFSVLFQKSSFDTLSGWRVMSTNFVKSFVGGNSGFEIEAELNAHTYLTHTEVAEITVTYRDRSRGSISKLRTYKDGFRILKMNFRLFRVERPMRAYGLMSFLFGLPGIMLMYRALRVYIASGLVPNFPSLIVGIGLLVIAILLFITGIILQEFRVIRISIAKVLSRMEWD